MEKEEIYQLIVKQQENAIEELRRYLESIEEVSNLDENSSLDVEDFARQNEAMDMVMRTRMQLEKAANDLEKLNEYIQMEFDEVVVGALVETNSLWLMIGVPVMTSKAGDKNLMGITAESPIYRAMVGKKKGAKVEVNGHEHEIVNVY